MIVIFKYSKIIYYVVILMPEIEITVKGYKCLRCSHEWIPKKQQYPKVCAKCHSPYWDTPRKKSMLKK